jgi:hypothetical protein
MSNRLKNGYFDQTECYIGAGDNVSRSNPGRRMIASDAAIARVVCRTNMLSRDKST